MIFNDQWLARLRDPAGDPFAHGQADAKRGGESSIDRHIEIVFNFIVEIDAADRRIEQRTGAFHDQVK